MSTDTNTETARLDAQMKLLPSYASSDEIKAFDLAWDAALQSRDADLLNYEILVANVDRLMAENQRLKEDHARFMPYVAGLESENQRLREALEHRKMGRHTTADEIERELALKAGSP